MMAAQGIDIVSRIRDEGLKAPKIHADDTPVPVLDPGRGRTATGRLWTYAVDERASGSSAPPLVWYRFTPDRTGAHPQAELAASPAISRPMPLPDMTSPTRPGASSRSPAGRISDARFSTSIRPSRPRSAPISSNGLRHSMPSRPTRAGSRPISDAARGRSAPRR